MFDLMNVLYHFSSREEFCCSILRTIARVRTIFIFDKKKRRQKTNSIFGKLRTKLYGYQVFKTAKSIGKELWCGGFSIVNKNTILKDYVN